MEETTKIRLYSKEDNLNDTLAWLALTDEQLRLLDYLIDNGFLTDGIDYTMVFWQMGLTMKSAENLNLKLFKEWQTFLFKDFNSVAILRKDKICSHYFYRKLIDITAKIKYNINTIKNRKENDYDYNNF